MAMTKKIEGINISIIAVITENNISLFSVPKIIRNQIIFGI